MVFNPSRAPTGWSIGTIWPALSISNQLNPPNVFVDPICDPNNNKGCRAVFAKSCVPFQEIVLAIEYPPT